MKSIWNFIKYVVFSYVLLALQDYPDVVLSHIFDILIFPFISFSLEEKKMEAVYFFFLIEKVPSLFSLLHLDINPQIHVWLYR